MNILMTTLVSIYTALVVLLLLGVHGCDGSLDEDHPMSAEMLEKEDSESEKELPVVKEKFKADIVMCIDCTSSMSSIIDAIKANALDIYPDLKRQCRLNGKVVNSMRIRVIGFRDFDDVRPFEASRFFSMPDEEDEFKSFVSRLLPVGGGDDFERGYDALGMAIMSDWYDEPDVHQVIIIWTDSGTHKLSPMSPGPKSMDELSSLWKKRMNADGKRLIVFAPNDRSWTAITDHWDKTVMHSTNLGGGLSDVDYEEILETLSESM